MGYDQDHPSRGISHSNHHYRPFPLDFLSKTPISPSSSLSLLAVLCLFQRHSSSEKENSVIVYTHSCRSKSSWPLFFKERNSYRFGTTGAWVNKSIDMGQQESWKQSSSLVRNMLMLFARCSENFPLLVFFSFSQGLGRFDPVLHFDCSSLLPKWNSSRPTSPICCFLMLFCCFFVFYLKASDTQSQKRLKHTRPK